MQCIDRQGVIDRRCSDSRPAGRIELLDDFLDVGCRHGGRHVAAGCGDCHDFQLGVEKSDKVSILANTRPEWTFIDFAALSVGATVVPIYQTNSAEESHYVLENSDACVVVVENEEQLAKVRAVRDRLPKL